MSEKKYGTTRFSNLLGRAEYLMRPLTTVTKERAILQAVAEEIDQVKQEILDELNQKGK